MKQFWSWPAFLRLVLANQQPFNVFDDIYAFPQVRLPPPPIEQSDFPQYEIDWLDHLPIKNSSADQLLSLHRQLTSSPSDAPPSSPTTGLVLESRTSPPRPAVDPGSDAPTSSPHRETYEVLMHGGQRYLCGMPSADVLAAASATTSNGTAQANRTAADEAGELSLATERGRELLAGMEGSCIYFVSGWWSYSFCYNEGVRQFHPLPTGRNVPVYPPQEDRSVDAYVLGRFDARRRGQKSIGEKSVAELEVKGQTRYLVHHLRGGTVCDLTGEERSIEVQFRCDSAAPTDKISLIKETAICQYRMVISTPRLCNDVAFQPPATVKPWRISCNPIVAEDGVDEYIARKAREIGAAASQESAGLGENDATADFLKMLGISIKDVPGAGQLLRESEDGRLVDLAGRPRTVGGVEVGGHNILPEGTKLEKG
jgi:protein OS-9